METFSAAGFVVLFFKKRARGFNPKITAVGLKQEG